MASHFSGIRTVGDFPHIYTLSKIQDVPYSIGNTPMLCIKNSAMCYKVLHYCILFAGVLNYCFLFGGGGGERISYTYTKEHLYVTPQSNN